jgi:hypothetical protein
MGSPDVELIGTGADEGFGEAEAGSCQADPDIEDLGHAGKELDMACFE